MPSVRELELELIVENNLQDTFFPPDLIMAVSWRIVALGRSLGPRPGRDKRPVPGGPKTDRNGVFSRREKVDI